MYISLNNCLFLKLWLKNVFLTSLEIAYSVLRTNDLKINIVLALQSKTRRKLKPFIQKISSFQPSHLFHQLAWSLHRYMNQFFEPHSRDCTHCCDSQSTIGETQTKAELQWQAYRWDVNKINKQQLLLKNTILYDS